MSHRSVYTRDTLGYILKVTTVKCCGYVYTNYNWTF